MGVITSRQLIKSYRNTKAVNQLTVQFNEGVITGLIGRNGAGKTTLLKMIAGLVKKSGGELSVFGDDPLNSLKVSANSIFVDDQLPLPLEFNVKDVLKEFERFYPNWDNELAERLTRHFSIELDALPINFSKGKLSTFNAIVGLAAHAPLTIFDEPTTGMDYSARQDFYRALLKDYMEHPRTIIVSSHLLNELEDVLEEIVLIHDGQLYFHETVTSLKEYAVGLTGDASELDSVTSKYDVLHKKDVGLNQQYVVIENQLEEKDEEHLKKMGVQITPVSPADVCVYVTNRESGGIDDVFNRNKHI
ncbi:ABC transporter ATP-binding protein [Alkalibacillus haloalkaliphilus]|uniref:ABC transporter ATP-binding protein n=1 Tax=Alkalibacillus haloalkaliphilus TaxID=94136 RepID=UPI002936277E|nr:ABC transporter ATP-binding protein [Alkalibacillus haloalkaliphilus]MDV2581976.1 ABC transporter ATP-binding protein [Alkalibacillus haloalkaliphilus]